MIENILLLEILKFLWLGFGIVRYFLHRKREKALIEALESYNQRLCKLEKIVKELKP